MTHQDASFTLIPNSIAYDKGKFGRLFPWLPPCSNDNDQLSDLYEIAALMKNDGKTNIPAGYTYLGQFLAHDLSFDPTSLKERQLDREFLYNFRTPALDLDSVYGGGPMVMPYLFNKAPLFHQSGELQRPRFGQFNVDATKPTVSRVGGPDGIAAIADPRNDENAIITQLHAAFMVLHNKFLEEQNCRDEQKRFFLARQQTIWHYQWVILWDYLPRIVGHKLVRKVLKKRKYFDWRNEPFIPLEFSAAAFRFGHSQVLNDYNFNSQQSGSIFIDNPSEIPPIDWSLFFFEAPPNSANANLTIGPHISGALKSMVPPSQTLEEIILQLGEEPSIESKKERLMKFILDVGWQLNENNLAFRNLLRGKLLRLPSGQDVARAMKKVPLSIETKNFPKKLVEHTPLWYYILYEADTLEEGKRLGPVGARIVAEVIIGLIKGDKTSFLNQYPNWSPEGKNSYGQFTMIELLKLAGLYPNTSA